MYISNGYYCNNDNYKKSYNNQNKKWSEIPYPGQSAPYSGVEPNAGYWPMNYFKNLGNGVFVDNFGRRIVWNIENPKNIDFNKDLKEVEYVQENITKEQIAMAKYWGSKIPIETIAPIALELIQAYNINPPRAARIMSVLTKAINDAFVITWYLKYLWDEPRPVQLNENLKTVLQTPKFSSYPSGHSVVSATAAEVMAYYFPSEREKLMKIAGEASISRLYGGIHFRADLEQGLKLGKQIGQLIVNKVSKERDEKGVLIDVPITEFVDAPIMPKY